MAAVPAVVTQGIRPRCALRMRPASRAHVLDALRSGSVAAAWSNGPREPGREPPLPTLAKIIIRNDRLTQFAVDEVGIRG